MPWVTHAWVRGCISLQPTNEGGEAELWERLPEATSELLQYELGHLDGTLGCGDGTVAKPPATGPFVEATSNAQRSTLRASMLIKNKGPDDGLRLEL